MARIKSTICEKVVLGAYCLYRFVLYAFDLGRNVKFALDQKPAPAFLWLDLHRWPELGMALCMMAIVGVISGRRFIYSFTAFFVFLHTISTFSRSSIYLFMLLTGSSMKCCERELKDPATASACQWSDICALLWLLAEFSFLIAMIRVVIERAVYGSSDTLLPMFEFPVQRPAAPAAK